MFRWLIILSTVLSMELYAEKKVLAFSGSLREDSTNKKLMKEAVAIAKEKGADVTVIDLRDFEMPFYDGDLEERNGLPPKAKELKALMEKSDVIIISSPEYNGSVSGALKNAIDWASRNDKSVGSSRSAFKGKKFILLSTSPGKSGGSRGLASLKAIIENIGGDVGGRMVAVPEGYSAFDAQGSLTNPTALSTIRQTVQQALE